MEKIEFIGKDGKVEQLEDLDEKIKEIQAKQKSLPKNKKVDQELDNKEKLVDKE